MMHNHTKFQKISTRQTFIDILKLRCERDLEHSNSFFSQQDTPAISFMQTKFGDKVETSHIFIMSALVDTLTVKIANLFLFFSPYDTPANNDASSYQVWWQNVW